MGSFEKIWMYMLIRIRKSESIFWAPKVWRSTFKKGLSIRWNMHKFEWAKHKDIKKNKFSFHSVFIMVEMEFLQEQESIDFFLPLSQESILHFFNSRKISLFYDLIQTWKVHFDIKEESFVRFWNGKSLEALKCILHRSVENSINLNCIMKFS